MKPLLGLLALLMLSACATTNPGDAAGIGYRLPRTDATVTVALDVTGCDPRGATVNSTFKIDPVASARDEIFQAQGAELASNVTKRGVTIDIDANGVISAVNTTSTDQGAVILGDIVKVAAAVVPLFKADLGVTAVVRCNAVTEQNLKNKLALQAKVTALQTSLATAGDPTAVQKQIDALAAQVVAVKAALHQDLTAKLKLETTMRGSAQAQDLAFDLSPLDAMFDTEYASAPPVPPIDHKLSKEGQAAFKIKAFYEDTATPTPALTGSTGGSLETCKLSLTVPATHYVSVNLDHSSAMLKGDNKAVVQILPASQLTAPAQLCLSAGFGENRVVNLKFDAYGRTTEFAWTSDARAANIATAIAGSASDTASVIAHLQGASLTADKAEIDKLNTAQALKKAKACQALLDAGAASC